MDIEDKWPDYIEDMRKVENLQTLTEMLGTKKELLEEKKSLLIDSLSDTLLLIKKTHDEFLLHFCEIKVINAKYKEKWKEKA